MKWTNTVEAVIEIERAGTKGQWRIGDAIVKDLREAGFGKANEKVNEINRGDFSELAERLKDKGIAPKRYSPQHCKLLLNTALSFDRNERDERYSWSVHRMAGTPANLKKAIAALHKVDKKITPDNILSITDHWRDQADAERRKRLAKARADKEKAKADKAKASRDKLATRDPDKRAAADDAIEEAKRQIKETTRAIKEAGGPPPFNADLNVDTSDISELRAWAIYFDIVLHTREMERQAKLTIAGVSKVADHLSEDQQQEIADGCNRIIDVLKSINELVKRPAHRLAAIQGGKQ